MKKQKTVTVSECIQCQGDEMLEVRKDARELHHIMGILTDAYGAKHYTGTAVTAYVEALIKAEADQKRFRLMYRKDAERVNNQLVELSSCLKFIAEACTHNSSTISVGGDQVMIGVADLLRVAVKRIEGIRNPFLGLLEGRQPQNEIDFIKPLMDPTK